MTVAELIEELKKFPQDAKVLMYGGDEMYHIATRVELMEGPYIEKEVGEKGPFVDLKEGE
ncbi:hypothetical protein EVC27_032 [Rhizobium phage RHph_I1_6]|uniref:Uncharacterized protein n=1 Tax=Rhizobium phage RHph_I1_6 TaxID=2509728 RepID=A0A7S5RFH4_9CAUD|nr:hypothetical protein PP745_gp032 [Rhizobium phage RHph_I1_6]QIG76557.1 hypothetical protein EVC27_032 [Rhizobium phage RHph_I1_6]